MGKVRKLTKASLLLGKDFVHNVYFEELEAELPLRSLTDGQWAQIEATKMKGQSLQGTPSFDKAGNVDAVKSQENLKMVIDLEKATLADYEADCLAVFFGITGDTVPGWTIDAVKRLEPPGIVKAIAEEIYHISGVKGKLLSDMKGFRGNNNRTRDNKSPHAGIQVGGQDSGLDACAAGISTGGTEEGARNNT